LNNEPDQFSLLNSNNILNKTISPGDPFIIDLNNSPDQFSPLNSNNILNKTVSSGISLTNANKTLADKNEINNLLSSSTLKPTEKTLFIYKKQ
jgi:phage replication-related protein YjqB (UPF0714/DUF867 family)